MIRNYLKTALRNLWRQRDSTIINIAGLTLGITSSLILFLIIMHYANFDRFHSKRDRIYRITHQSRGNDGLGYSPGVPAVFPEAFKNDFPEAEEVVFTSYRSGSLVSIPEANGEMKKYSEDNGVVFTQPSFFKIFDRRVIIGNAAKGLDEPNEAILSRRSAIRYFGKEDVIGEVLVFDKAAYKITAVMEDFPSNTDFPFDLMLSYVTIKKELDAHGWNSVWSDEQCYFLLKEGEHPMTIESRLPAFVTKYFGDRNDHELTYTLQPLRELHFDDRFSNYNYNVTPRPVLFSLGVISLLLILTACINFINLTTAEAIKRSKEVGIRKSLGSSRSQLIVQFLGETSLVTMGAVFLSLICAQLVLIYLNLFLDLSLEINLADLRIWAFLTGIIVVVSSLSGLYPSLIVSAFKPATALKNQSSNKSSSGYNLRRGLVVLQFFISQFFIIETIVLIQQMDYFEKKELGFAKESILTIPIPEKEKPVSESGGASKMRTLKNEILRINGIEKASLNHTPPSSGNTSGSVFTIEGRGENFGTQVKAIDGDYVGLFELQLATGKNLADRDTATGFLVNEKLVKTTGFSAEEIIGKQMKLWGKRLPVVGVIKDFHTVSLSDAIEPVVMFNRIKGYERLSLKLNTTELQVTLRQVQEKWEAAYPDFIFHYEFLDEEIKGFYETERKLSTMVTIFALLAIFIGCIGLFGLATFIANQKTKEIGVRKVLGASVESILILFSKEFISLILIGFMIAVPFGWWVSNQYLEQFTYRITLSPLIFVISIGSTTLIALLTVGFRTFKAATINPAHSLRLE